MNTDDRFGLSWRPALALGVLANTDHVDVVEVIAEHWLGASARELNGLRTLASALPVMLHGISLGPASAAPVEDRRLERMAKLMEKTGIERWSEHLAFVRGGGVEIGHLAAPPRTDAVIEGAIKNLRRARSIVGVAPAMENVATLIAPPASVYDEVSFTRAILEAADVPLLLDLHNLWANAQSFGGDARAWLAALPLERVATVHLAGGRALPASGRILDDHLHPVPPEVFALLEELAARSLAPLTVIIERDGRFPPFEELLRELSLARAAVAAGRARRAA
jgi:uncharacterized protein (UPF0276 family)